jgi:hypothetical protein
VVVAADGPLHALADLPAHLTVASTDAPDVELSTRVRAELLAGLGAPHGWERVSIEDTRFMIDFMDALSQG